MTKNKALLLNFHKLARHYKVEIYGACKFLEDFYTTEADLPFVAERIKRSEENTICAVFYFETNCDAAELLELFGTFKEL
jgi:hypothetical protein